MHRVLLGVEPFRTGLVWMRRRQGGTGLGAIYVIGNARGGAKKGG